MQRTSVLHADAFATWTGDRVYRTLLVFNFSRCRFLNIPLVVKLLMIVDVHRRTIDALVVSNEDF
jgi:hypothetical protein